MQITFHRGVRVRVREGDRMRTLVRVMVHIRVRRGVKGKVKVRREV